MHTSYPTGKFPIAFLADRATTTYVLSTALGCAAHLGTGPQRRLSEFPVFRRTSQENA